MMKKPKKLKPKKQRIADARALLLAEGYLLLLGNDPVARTVDRHAVIVSGKLRGWIERGRYSAEAAVGEVVRFHLGDQR